MPDTGDMINRALEEMDVGVDASTEAVAPVSSFRVFPESKIPVSKSTGALWSARIGAAKKALVPAIDRWDEVTKYFYNDQTAHRRSRDHGAGNEAAALKGKGWTETENIVYANLMAMVPALYAKNPSVEITTTSGMEQDDNAARAAELLINTLASKRASPGLNLHVRGKRGILHGLAYNEAWLYVGYVTRDQSSVGFTETISRIAEELADKATTQARIIELEGELLAIEEASDFVSPPGPDVKLMHPRDVFVDPNSTEEDLVDAAWVAARVMMHAGYIKAKYFKKGKDNEQYSSLYEPTHILNVQADETTKNDQDSTIFASMREGASTHKDYGFGDEAAYKQSLYIETVHVWDKVTRRLLIFNAKQMTWPIWVYDDPFGYPTFFPFVRLSLSTDLAGARGRGEASYYLDQQDSINEVNSGIQHARARSRHSLLYDKKSVKDPSTLEALTTGVSDRAVGVDLPDGKTPNDVIWAAPVPALNISELFNKNDLYAAVDRIGGYSDVMRGAEFRTNTTNKAIDAYNSVSTQKIDEKVDAVEEWLGTALSMVLHCCVKWMPDDMVARLIGDQRMPAWMMYKDLSNQEKITVRILGGSTQKPTGAAKKKQALEVGQILGQFASASPTTVLVMLKVMEQAFDEIVITAEDWQEIRASIEQQMAGPTGVAGGAPQEQPEPEPDQLINDVVNRAVEKGVPKNVALRKVQERVRQETTAQ